MTTGRAPALTGRVTDFGDLLHVERWIVKGKHLYVVWHIGATRDTVPEDRIIQQGAYAPPTTERIDLVMDLMSDKKVALSPGWTDEMGNPTSPPTTFTASYTIDDPTHVNLIDNGDNTATAAAVGTLGTANIHMSVSSDIGVFEGDLQIVVVAGLAERVNVVAGEPEEVTPDDLP